MIEEEAVHKRLNPTEASLGSRTTPNVVYRYLRPNFTLKHRRHLDFARTGNTTTKKDSAFSAPSTIHGATALDDSFLFA
jgi:hypothetical protein